MEEEFLRPGMTHQPCLAVKGQPLGETSIAVIFSCVRRAITLSTPLRLPEPQLGPHLRSW